MSALQQILMSYGGSSVPPIPPFSSVSLCAGLFNGNPDDYTGGLAINLGDNEDNYNFSVSAPYPPNWASIAGAGGDNPFTLNTLADQNGQLNNFSASGAARPTLQVTTPVVVSGAGTAAANGTYSYRGRDGAGRPYYNLEEQLTSFSNFCISGDGSNWFLTGALASQLYLSNSGTAFPWQDAWDIWNDGVAPTPTVVQGAGQGEIVYDGVANGMQSANVLTLDKTFTLNKVFRLTSSNPTGVLFEVGASPLTTDGGISATFVAGLLTVSVANATTHLLNTRTKTISDQNPHILSVRVNTAASGGTNQLTVLVDGSSSGVNTPLATDLASVVLDNGKLNTGARNGAASAFLPYADRTDTFVQTARLSDADNLVVYNYFNYLNGLYVGPS